MTAALDPVSVEVLALIDQMGRMTCREMAEARDTHRRTALFSLTRLMQRGLVAVTNYRYIRGARPAQIFDLTPDGALVLWLEGLLTKRTDLLSTMKTDSSIENVRHWRQLGVSWETVEFMTHKSQKTWRRLLRQAGEQNADVARL